MVLAHSVGHARRAEMMELAHHSSGNPSNLLKKELALGIEEENRESTMELASWALRAEDMSLIFVVRSCLKRSRQLSQVAFSD